MIGVIRDGENYEIIDKYCLNRIVSDCIIFENQLTYFWYPAGPNEMADLCKLLPKAHQKLNDFRTLLFKLDRDILSV